MFSPSEGNRYPDSNKSGSHERSLESPWSEIDFSVALDNHRQELLSDLKGIAHRTQESDLDRYVRQENAEKYLAHHVNEPAIARKLLDIALAHGHVTWWSRDQRDPSFPLMTSYLLGSMDHPVADAARRLLRKVTDEDLSWYLNVELAIDEARTVPRRLWHDSEQRPESIVHNDIEMESYNRSISFLREHHNHPYVVTRLLQCNRELPNIVSQALAGTKSPEVLSQIREQFEMTIAGEEIKEEILSPTIIAGTNDPELALLAIQALRSPHVNRLTSFLPGAFHKNMSPFVRRELCDCLLSVSRTDGPEDFRMKWVTADIIRAGISSDPISRKRLESFLTRNRFHASLEIARKSFPLLSQRISSALRLSIDGRRYNRLDHIRFFVARAIYPESETARDFLYQAFESAEGTSLKCRARSCVPDLMHQYLEQDPDTRS